MAKPQIDPDLIPKIHAICDRETDHVTIMAVVAGELFNAVNGFDWVGFYRVAEPGVLKLLPDQGGHGCLIIPYDKAYAARRPATGKPKLLTMWIDLMGILPLPHQQSLNWLLRCLIGTKI